MSDLYVVFSRMKQVFIFFFCMTTILVEASGNISYANTDINITKLLNTKILPSNKKYLMLDGTRFKGAHPSLGTKVTVLYEDQVLGGFKNYGQAPNEVLVKKRLSKFKGLDRIILDIESWSIGTRQRLDPLASQHAQWYLQVLRWAREVLPGTDLGYFGMPFSPWFAIKKPEIFLTDYQAMNDYILPILQESDTLYPSFYLYYDDEKHLMKVMRMQISIGRFLNKPVLPFLWHRGPGSFFNSRVLSSGLMTTQCEFVKKFADGFVWWSISWEKWNQAEWYGIATKCFR